MSTLLNFEIVKHEPYRFIGKSVYARAFLQCGDAWFHDFLQENAGWVFEKLDEIKEFNSDIPQKANLMTWDKYCEKTKLLGFTAGKFMKPDCPVPAGEGYFGIGGLDYFDITEGYMAVGKFDHSEDGTHEEKIREAIEKHCGYTVRDDKFMGELDFGDEKHYGFFIACDKK